MLCGAATITLRHIRRLSTTVAFRHIRCLSTTATLCHIRCLSTTTTNSTGITISKANSQLRSDSDPDEALSDYDSEEALSDSDTGEHFEIYDPYKDKFMIRLANDNAVPIPAMTTLINFQISQPNKNITHEPYLSTIIRTYGIIGNFDAALDYYHRMDQLGTPRTSISFNAILSACSKSTHDNNVPTLFEQIIQQYGVVPDEVSYGILVKWFCKAGQPENALQILKEVEEKNVVEITADTYRIVLIALYSKKNRDDVAEKLWSLMKVKDCIDIDAYHVRLKYVSGGVPEKVKAIIVEMVDVGLKPDTFTYNYLMTCYLECGMIKEAKEIYAGLDEKGCHPNFATLSTLVFHLCMNEDFEGGLRVFKESVEVHKIPDLDNLNLLVQGLLTEGKEEQVKDLKRIVEMEFPMAWAKVEKNLNLSCANDDTQEDSAI